MLCLLSCSLSSHTEVIDATGRVFLSAVTVRGMTTTRCLTSFSSFSRLAHSFGKCEREQNVRERFCVKRQPQEKAGSSRERREEQQSATERATSILSLLCDLFDDAHTNYFPEFELLETNRVHSLQSRSLFFLSEQ